jgi:hypothetical protein
MQVFRSVPSTTSALLMLWMLVSQEHHAMDAMGEE